MRTRHVPLAPGRALHRLRRHLRSALEAGQRRELADLRFYQLLSDADGNEGGDQRGTSVHGSRRTPYR